MSKSVGNYIGVTEDPRERDGKIMSIPDEVMLTYYRLLTPHHSDELARIEQDYESGAVNPRDLKARLARDMITRLHGAEAAGAAEERFDSVFRRHESAADLQELTLQAADVEEGGTVFLPALLERWLGQTRSEWRRRIQQGGVSLDGEPVTDLAVPAAALAGRHLKAGKSATTQGVDPGALEAPSSRTAGLGGSLEWGLRRQIAHLRLTLPLHGVYSLSASGVRSS